MTATESTPPPETVTDGPQVTPQETSPDTLTNPDASDAVAEASPGSASPAPVLVEDVPAPEHAVFRAGTDPANAPIAEHRDYDYTKNDETETP